MERGENPLSWSFSVGTWLGTRVRVSFLLPLLMLLLIVRFGGKLGSVYCAVLVVSIIIHEFAHVFGARWSGGFSDEVLLWPLGGMAMCRPGPTLGSELVTTLAGPISNLVLCVASLPAVLFSGMLKDVINPFELPDVAGLWNQPVNLVLVLTFACNWVLLLVNLIPIQPLDGGQALSAVLERAYERAMARRYLHLAGSIASGCIAFGGLLWDKSGVVFFGMVLLLHNLLSAIREQVGDGGDGEEWRTGNFGWGVADGEAVPKGSWFSRWKRERDAKKLQEKTERAHQAAQAVDALLEKVHESGLESLTPSERKMLSEASAVFRTKLTSAPNQDGDQ